MSRPDPLRLGVLLRRSHSKAARALDAALEPWAITGRHFGVLLHLSLREDSTHTELIALTGSDKAGMARTIDSLVASGLIARQPSATDRRVNRLTLTETGSAVAAGARERAAAVGDQLFSAFTEAELNQLTELLQKLVDEPPGHGLGFAARIGDN